MFYTVCVLEKCWLILLILAIWLGAGALMLLFFRHHDNGDE
jgi:hypothetical protein